MSRAAATVRVSFSRFSFHFLLTWEGINDLCCFLNFSGDSQSRSRSGKLWEALRSSLPSSYALGPWWDQDLPLFLTEKSSDEGCHSCFHDVWLGNIANSSSGISHAWWSGSWRSLEWSLLNKHQPITIPQPQVKDSITNLGRFRN